MKQEFVTLYGKAIVERDVVFIRNMDVPFSRSSFVRILYELGFVGIFVLSFFREDGPRRYIALLIWGILLLTRLPQWYVILFRRSYANRIPINRIRSVTTENDQFGLNSFVNLELTNGRIRKIPFRTMEKQYEDFIETISHKLALPQLA